MECLLRFAFLCDIDLWVLALDVVAMSSVARTVLDAAGFGAVPGAAMGSTGVDCGVVARGLAVCGGTTGGVA